VLIGLSILAVQLQQPLQPEVTEWLRVDTRAVPHHQLHRTVSSNHSIQPISSLKRPSRQGLRVLVVLQDRPI
jgi:hypothetical protein